MVILSDRHHIYVLVSISLDLLHIHTTNQYGVGGMSTTHEEEGTIKTFMVRKFHHATMVDYFGDMHRVGVHHGLVQIQT